MQKVVIEMGPFLIEGDWEHFIKNINDYSMDGSDVGDYEDYDVAAEEMEKKTASFIMTNDLGVVTISGWVDSRIDEFIIEDFSAEPTRIGLGRASLIQLKYEMDKINLSLAVGDETDEAKEFWTKMFEEGIIG